MPIFEYGTKELNYLQVKDAKMASLIEQYGLIEREITPDCFTALMSQIVGQQISIKAMQTIWQRLQTNLGQINPQNVLEQGELIRSSGISSRKVTYMQGIARAFLDCELDPLILPQLSDEELIAKLIVYPGIGVWSAEMFLIFCLGRGNILSYGDLAIKKSLQQNYDIPNLSKDIFQEYHKLFSPYATTASLYLWAAVNNNPTK